MHDPPNVQALEEAGIELYSVIEYLDRSAQLLSDVRRHSHGALSSTHFDNLVVVNDPVLIPDTALGTYFGIHPELFSLATIQESWIVDYRTAWTELSSGLVQRVVQTIARVRRTLENLAFTRRVVALFRQRSYAQFLSNILLRQSSFFHIHGEHPPRAQAIDPDSCLRGCTA
jgi:hypothetical protein